MWLHSRLLPLNTGKMRYGARQHKGILGMAKKVELHDMYRDVKTGKFVTERDHERRPNTTEHERRPFPSPKPEHKPQPPRKGK
jgi:hypothetical protein